MRRGKKAPELRETAPRHPRRAALARAGGGVEAPEAEAGAAGAASSGGWKTALTMVVLL